MSYVGDYLILGVLYGCIEIDYGIFVYEYYYYEEYEEGEYYDEYEGEEEYEEFVFV